MKAMGIWGKKVISAVLSLAMTITSGCIPASAFEEVVTDNQNLEKVCMSGTDMVEDDVNSEYSDSDDVHEDNTSNSNEFFMKETEDDSILNSDEVSDFVCHVYSEEDISGVLDNDVSAVFGVLINYNQNEVIIDETSIPFYWVSENKEADQTVLNTAKSLLGENVKCLVKNGQAYGLEKKDAIVIGIDEDEDSRLPKSEGKVTLYAVSRADSYEGYEKSEYGTIKNVTFYIDSIPYFTSVGYLQIDCDDELHSVKIVAAGFADSGTKVYCDFSQSKAIEYMLYPKNGDAALSHVKGKLKSVDILMGNITLENGSIYELADNLNAPTDKLNKYVKLTIEYGLVTQIEECKSFNLQPYGKKRTSDYSKEEIVRMTAKEYNDALTGYLSSLKEASQTAVKNKNKNTKSAGKALRELDESRADRYLTMELAEDKYIDAAYEGLAQYLDQHVYTAVSLGKIDLSKDMVEIDASIVNKVRNSLKSEDFKTTVNGYVVEISILSQGWGPFETQTGVLTVKKCQKSVEYIGYFQTGTDTTKQVLDEYINQASTSVKDLEKQALQSIITEFITVTGFGEFTKEMLKDLLKDKISALQKIGCGGNILKYTLMLKDDYDACKDILNMVSSSDFSKSLSKSKGIYNRIKNRDYSDESVNNSYVNTALSAIERAGSRFSDALFDYIYDENTFKEKWGNSFDEAVKKIFINCPVDFIIKDGNSVVGSYVDGKVYEQPAYLNIEIYGDRKVVYINKDFDASISYIPTADGIMDLVIEDYDDGEPTGRLCYYDLELTEGENYSQSVDTSVFTDKLDQYPLSNSEGNTIIANEIILAEDDAKVSVSCDIEGSGIVVGSGDDYIKGDAITLVAVPDEGYTLDGWYENGILSGIEDTYEIVANKDRNVIAKFVKNKKLNYNFYTRLIGRDSEIINAMVYNNDDKDLIDIKINVHGIESGDDYTSMKLNVFDGGNELSKLDVVPTVDNGSLWIKGVDLNGGDRIVVNNSSGEAILNIYDIKDYLKYENEITLSTGILEEDIICKELKIPSGIEIETNGHSIIVTETVEQIDRYMAIKMTFDNGSKIRIYDDFSLDADYRDKELSLYINHSDVFIEGGFVLKGDSIAMNDHYSTVEMDTSKLYVNDDFGVYSCSLSMTKSELFVGGNYNWDLKKNNNNIKEINLSESDIYVVGNKILCNDEYGHRVSGSTLADINCDDKTRFIYVGDEKDISIDGYVANFMSTNPEVNIEFKNMYVNYLLSDINAHPPKGSAENHTIEIRDLRNNEVKIINDDDQNPNVTLKSTFIDEGKISYNGNVPLTICDVDLGKGRFEVNNSIIHNEGYLNINKGYLLCEGNYYGRKNGETIYGKAFSPACGLIIMREPEGVMEVKDGFYYKPLQTSIYRENEYFATVSNDEARKAVTDGIFKVHGDVYIGEASSFYCENKMIFEIEKKIDMNIYGNMNYTLFTGENPVVINVGEFSGLSLGILLSDLIVNVDFHRCYIYGNTNLNGHSVQINIKEDHEPALYIYGKLDLDGGDLLTNSQVFLHGTVYVNGGRLEIGRYLKVYEKGLLYMSDSSDEVFVKEDLFISEDMQQISNKLDFINDGQLTIGGRLFLEDFNYDTFIKAKYIDVKSHEIYNRYSEDHYITIDTLKLDKDVDIDRYTIENVKYNNLIYDWDKYYIDGEVSGKCGEKAIWTLSDKGVLKISGEGPTYNYYNKTKPWEKYLERIKKIVVETGITQIGDGCFDCFGEGVLNEVLLKTGLKSIGKNAFSYCRISEIIIPEGVEEIGSDAFSNNPNLCSVVIPDSVVKIGDDVFWACDNIKSAGPRDGDYCIKYGWEDCIPDYAFSSSEIETVIIKPSICNIGKYSFADTNIEEIMIPSGMTVGEGAFNYCFKLNKVVINKNVTLEDRVFGGCSELKTAGPIGGDYNYQYDFTDGVIQDYCFSGCNYLENIVLPDCISEIGIKAFSGTLIKEISISENTVVKEGAFNYCSSLEKVVLYGDHIAGRMFNGCKLLKTAGPIGGNYNIQYSWKNSVPDKAFENCEYLESVVLPDECLSIGNLSFYCCKNLISVEIPKNVKKIGHDAFSLCNLTSVDIPESVEEIGMDAFYSNKSLESIVIPAKVSVIEAFAFGGCENLKEVVIPSSINEIFEVSFYESDNIEKVYYEGTENEWNSIVVRESGYFENSPLMSNVFKTAIIYFNYRYDESIKRYTVSFDSNDGQIVMSRTVRDGSKVMKPSNPSRKGYIFQGWYTDADMTQEYDFDLPVHSDMVLIARWGDEDNIYKDSSSSSSESGSYTGDQDSSSSSTRSMSDKDKGSSSDKDRRSSSEEEKNTDNSSSEMKKGKSSSSFVSEIETNIFFARTITTEKSAMNIVGDDIRLKIPNVDPGHIHLKGKAGTYQVTTDPVTGEKIGIVKAVKKGTIKLYVLNGKKKITVCVIKVEQPKLKSSLKLKNGKTKKLKLSGTKTTPDSWVSSDMEIVAVDNTGMLSAKKPGSATVTATIGAHEYKCNVTVK